MNKYILPASLTWWGAVIPMIGGIIIATEPLHGWTAGVQSVQNMVGNVSPAILINAGLVAIGMRAAL